MLYRIIDADDLTVVNPSLHGLIRTCSPGRTWPGYIFDVIDDPSDVVLDYPTTIASPKSISFRPRKPCLNST